MKPIRLVMAAILILLLLLGLTLCVFQPSKLEPVPDAGGLLDLHLIV